MVTGLYIMSITTDKHRFYKYTPSGQLVNKNMGNLLQTSSKTFLRYGTAQTQMGRSKMKGWTNLHNLIIFIKGVVNISEVVGRTWWRVAIMAKVDWPPIWVHQEDACSSVGWMFRLFIDIVMDTNGLFAFLLEEQVCHLRSCMCMWYISLKSCFGVNNMKTNTIWICMIYIKL